MYRKFYNFISIILKQVLILVESILFLRLILKFLGASPKAVGINYFYKLSYYFVYPFEGIFPNLFWQNRLIETSTLSALIIYFLLVFVFLRFLKTFN